MFSQHTLLGDWAINGYSATGPAVFGESNGYYWYLWKLGKYLAVWARNNHASGTGLLQSGNNQAGSYLTTGTGIASIRWLMEYMERER